MQHDVTAAKQRIADWVTVRNIKAVGD